MISPLTGLVDAARPDSDSARQFALLVEGFVSDPPRFRLYRSEIRDSLISWRDAGIALGPIIDRAPALEEGRPLAKNLAEVAAAGIEAMAYLSTGDVATTEWRDAQLDKLDDAAQPKAALELVIVASVRKLVVAAAELPQPK